MTYVDHVYRHVIAILDGTEDTTLSAEILLHPWQPHCECPVDCEYLAPGRSPCCGRLNTKGGRRGE